ncbi:MAG: hypothetical protein IJN28_05365 [Selenomonadales bacterium]|nr:hypothetical protein [Selenomonadales bacterium]
MSKVHGFKGYDKNLQCRGFQYEVGKTYEHEGKAVTCESGFHFCEYPLDVFDYYPPADSRYTEVVGEGCADNSGQNDTKVCVSKLTIGAEIGIPGIVKATIEYVKSHIDADKEEKQEGDWSAATNTGYWSAATNTGYWSAASVSGKESVAMAIGYDSKAKGALGCWIILGEQKQDEKYNWHLVDVQCFKVDGEKIKADTFYKLKDGQPIEAEE